MAAIAETSYRVAFADILEPEALAARDAAFDRGLRSYFEYRDLGIAQATEGRVVAHVIRPAAGTACSGQSHLHRTTFQKYFGDLAPTGVAAYLKDGADPERVRTEMLASLDEGHRAFIFSNRALRNARHHIPLHPCKECGCEIQSNHEQHNPQHSIEVDALAGHNVHRRQHVGELITPRGAQLFDQFLLADASGELL